MNILIFSWRATGHPNAGGAEQATMEHAKAWASAGHNVTIFSSSYIGYKKKEVINGVEIIRSGRQLLGVQIAAFVWYIFSKHPKYDLVVDQFHGIPFFTPIFVKTKILAYIHEVATQVWDKNELPEPYNKIASFLGPKVEPLIFKIYKNIEFLTVSDSTKNDLVAFGIPKNNIHVIFNGVRLVKVKNTKKHKLVTFLGALSKDKGVEDAIRVFSEINKKDDSWSFIIVGKGASNYVKDLKQFARSLQLGNKINFEGFVSERKKFEILAKSFCMVNTSVHEGWGLVNIEANSVGTPVFAFSVKGIVDSVVDGKTGELFSKNDLHQMGMEIIKLDNDKKSYEIMTKNCIKWSQKFSWDKSTKESTELIESL